MHFNKHKKPICFWEKLELALDSETHQARTWKSLGESSDREIQFVWDLLPGCSNWMGFIKQRRLTGVDQQDVIRKVCCSESLCRSTQINRLIDDCFCIRRPAYELVFSTLRITSCPLFSWRGQWSSEARRCQNGAKCEVKKSEEMYN